MKKLLFTTIALFTMAVLASAQTNSNECAQLIASNKQLAIDIKMYTDTWDKIFNKGGLKIGVFGIGIELKGLVGEAQYQNTHYLEPIQIANATAAMLKRKESCDMVICLSHLGYEYEGRKVSDLILAKQSEYIDLIIGGHTHTFLDQPTILTNKQGKEVVINQVGWAGLRLGRLDYEFGNFSRKNLAKAHSVIISK